MELDPTSIITAIVTGVSGIGLGLLSNRSKKESENLAVVASKDEIVLVHYDKIVDQLQEEVTFLRQENAELRQHNLQLEKDMLNMSRQVFEITKEIEDLKKWISQNMETGTK